MSKTTKTAAKRMGIKSTLAFGDKQLAITTFGKGNEAEIAVKTKSRGEDLGEMPYTDDNIRFTIHKIGEKIDVRQGELEAYLHNPAEEVRSGEDYLQLKSTLETEFFGKPFPNDSIRIQIIYNILDIIKIFGLYVNDIIYCVNNLQDEETVSLLGKNDIVGLSLESKKKMEDVLKKMSPYFGLFGDAFKPLPPKKNGKSDTNAEKEINEYNWKVLQVLGKIRQLTAHYKDMTPFFTGYKDIKKNSKKDIEKPNLKEVWSVIEECYNNRIEEINANFLTNSVMNLNILFEALGTITSDDKVEVVNKYYRFSIRKEGRNLGVNMRKTREIMFKKFFPQICEKVYDSYRSKIYTITDFVLFYDLEKSKELEQMVALLRMTPDEEAKEELYEGFAEAVWERTESTLIPFFNQIRRMFESDQNDNEGYKKPLPKSVVEKLKFINTGGNEIPLVMLLSFLCNFLEGKEINELLTAYIHKFENIQAFMDTLKKLGEDVTFSNNYHAFNDHGSHLAKDISDQLRFIVSISKMKPKMPNVKRLLYKMAIQTLGVPDDSQYITDKWLEENVLLDHSSPNYKTMKWTINPFRNFIARNVIESRRFMFLVRYTKPTTVRRLMNNRKIVQYVLSRLPENQIDSYFENINPNNGKDVPYKKKIDDLANKLTVFSFDDLFNQRSGIATNTKLNSSNKNKEIERLKALTRLYLTTAYVAIKNLVKVNARYYIAFAVFERDFSMMEKKDKDNLLQGVIKFKRKDKEAKEKEYECKYFALTEYYLDREDENDFLIIEGKPFDRMAFFDHLKKTKRHFKKKWRDIFRNNIAEAKEISNTGFLLTLARNNTEHLNVLAALPTYVDGFRKGTPNHPMTSYFELYHYILQKLFINTEELSFSPDSESDSDLNPNLSFNLDTDSNPENDLNFRKYIDRLGVPSNNLIKIAYASLGYNLARYKNLTIEALFDKDSESGKKREEHNSKK